MIIIVKVYDKQQPNTHREYCGRPGKGQEGLLGNPFWMKDESKRNEACDKYQQYFKSIIDCRFTSSLTLEELDIKAKLSELVEIAKTQDIELACFCSPKRCHTETIKAYIEQQLKLETIPKHNRNNSEFQILMNYW